MTAWIEQVCLTENPSPETWDLFVHGPLAGAEQRAIQSQKWVSRNTPRLEVKCASVPDLTFNLRFTQGSLDEYWPATHWYDVGDKLGQILDTLKKQEQKLRVLTDLSDGGWEICFFLFPRLLNTPELDLTCLFSAPESYPQAQNADAHPPIDTWGIRQPPAFLSTWPEQYQGRPKVFHIFLAGFDPERPNKFISKYNWDTGREVIAVIGNPPFVKGGLQDARSANSRLLQELERRNITPPVVELPANNPFKVADWLQEKFRDADYMDIIPIGATPMLLGAVLFYFSLSEEEQNRIRFLHDFPKRKSGRTNGVGDSWLYRCSAYLEEQTATHQSWQ